MNVCESHRQTGVNAGNCVQFMQMNRRLYKKGVKSDVFRQNRHDRSRRIYH